MYLSVSTCVCVHARARVCVFLNASERAHVKELIIGADLRLKNCRLCRRHEQSRPGYS